MSKVINQLHQLQADSHALYFKFHDYHWNVKGMHFFAVHEYTEKAYDQMSELFDELAERALQLGGKALTCQKMLLETAKCPTISQETYTAKDVITAVNEAYLYLKQAFIKLREYADEVDDFTTVGLAEDNIAELEKSIWMINCTLAG